MKIEQTVREWLVESDYRRIALSHGGEGGRFYVLKEDDGNAVGDGFGETIEAALESAFREKPKRAKKG